MTMMVVVSKFYSLANGIECSEQPEIRPCLTFL